MKAKIGHALTVKSASSSSDHPKLYGELSSWFHLVTRPEDYVEEATYYFGLFPRRTWLRLLREVGFQAKIVHDPWKREVFIGVKPKR
jgi:hypothetical protein